MTPIYDAGTRAQEIEMARRQARMRLANPPAFDKRPRTYFAFPGPYTLLEERASFQDAVNLAAVKLNNIRAENKERGTLVPERVAFERRVVERTEHGFVDRPERRWTLSSEDIHA